MPAPVIGGRAALLGVTLAVVLLTWAPSARAACGFTLGFADLAALIPDAVGACVADPTPQPNGDVLQQTTGGLLVWRKADNWTAFTDGATTWILGPFGLQSRPNGQLLDWEVTAATPPESRALGQPWVGPGVTLTLDRLDSGLVGSERAVTIYYTLANTASEPLSLAIDQAEAIQVTDNLDRRYPLLCCATAPVLTVTIQPGEELHTFAQYRGDTTAPGVERLEIRFRALATLEDAIWSVSIE